MTYEYKIKYRIKIQIFFFFDGEAVPLKTIQGAFTVL